MQLSDYTSWIQLSATLNIAFVAAEYVRSYAKIVYDQIFNISDLLERHFAPCKKALGEVQTVNNLRPKTLEGLNTFTKIEEIKRRREKLTTELENDKKSLQKETEEKCNTRCMSTLSLYVFFYALTALFLSGLNSSVFVKNLWTCLTIFSIFFLILGCFIGEKNIKLGLLNYGSLRFPLIIFPVFLLLSLIISYFYEINFLWDYFFWGSLFVMFSNFIIFVIVVWRKITEIRKSIKTKANLRQEKCDQWLSDLNELLSLEKIHKGLKAETFRNSDRSVTVYPSSDEDASARNDNYPSSTLNYKVQKTYNIVTLRKKWIRKGKESLTSDEMRFMIQNDQIIIGTFGVIKTYKLKK